MRGKTKSVAQELIKRHTEVKVGDRYIHNETTDLHGVLGLAIYEDDKPLVLHQKIGDTELVEATHINKFFAEYFRA